MWGCEEIVFNAVYKTNQIKKINTIVTEFNKGNKDIYNLAENLAYNNEVCISVIDEDNVVINFNTLQYGCLLNKNSSIVYNIASKFIKGNEKSDYYELVNDDKTQYIYFNL